MSETLKNIKWFPPAETKIPLSALSRGFKKNLAAAKHALCAETKAADCIFGPSARALLYKVLDKLFLHDGKKRNEVLIPAYTCYSVAAAIVKAGLKIKLYDMVPSGFDPERTSFEQSVSSKTLAVVTQHLMGIPSKIDHITKFTKSEGIYHIEDAAQGLGGCLDGKRLGTAGDFGLFSFGRGKPLPLGGGGAIISNLPEFKDLSIEFPMGSGWKSLGVSVLSQAVAKPYVYGIAEKLPLGLGRTVFDPNFNIETTPIKLINLIEPMLIHLNGMNQHRRTIAAVYQKIIPALNQIPISKGAVPVYPRFPVLAKFGNLPQELIRLGVRRLYPKSLNQERQIAPYLPDSSQTFQGAQLLADRLVSLPTHHLIDANLAEIIGNKITKWLDD